MRDLDLLDADPVARPRAPVSVAQRAGFVAGGVALLVVSLGLAAAPIVVAVLIVRAVTK